MKSPKESTSSTNKTGKIVKKAQPTTTKSSKKTEEEESLLFVGSYYMLKVLFWDLLIAFCRLGSDFLQGWTLLFTEGKATYGIVTFAIVWTPGIAASIYLLAAYRREFAWYKTLLFALLLLLTYPIVPIVALLILLWMNPGDGVKEDDKRMKDFREAQHGVTVAYILQGCIASPIQVAFQVWLALTGNQSLNPAELRNQTIEIKDWFGNVINIPYVAPANIILSILL